MLLCINLLSGQVAIGNNATFVSAQGVFDLSNQNSPLILPNISSRPGNAVEGTLIFDNSSRKIVYKSDAAWRELTLNAGIKNTPTATLLSVPEPDGVTIGSTISSVPGVLVLEVTDKALVLPRLSNPQNISLPSSGSIIFDSDRKMIAVYNGIEWSFWEVPLIFTQISETMSAGAPIDKDVTIAYKGGKGIAYPAGNIIKNGITMTYPAGSFAASGSITAHLSGTAILPGTTIFSIMEGSQPFDMVAITVN